MLHNGINDIAFTLDSSDESSILLPDVAELEVGLDGSSGISMSELST